MISIIDMELRGATIADVRAAQAANSVEAGATLYPTTQIEMNAAKLERQRAEDQRTIERNRAQREASSEDKPFNNAFAGLEVLNA